MSQNHQRLPSATVLSRGQGLRRTNNSTNLAVQAFPQVVGIRDSGAQERAAANAARQAAAQQQPAPGHFRQTQSGGGQPVTTPGRASATTEG